QINIATNQCSNSCRIVRDGAKGYTRPKSLLASKILVAGKDQPVAGLEFYELVRTRPYCRFARDEIALQRGTCNFSRNDRNLRHLMQQRWIGPLRHEADGLRIDCAELFDAINRPAIRSGRLRQVPCAFE